MSPHDERPLVVEVSVVVDVGGRLDPVADVVDRDRDLAHAGGAAKHCDEAHVRAGPVADRVGRRFAGQRVEPVVDELLDLAVGLTERGEVDVDRESCASLRRQVEIRLLLGAPNGDVLLEQLLELGEVLAARHPHRERRLRTLPLQCSQLLRVLDLHFDLACVAGDETLVSAEEVEPAGDLKACRELDGVGEHRRAGDGDGGTVGAQGSERFGPLRLPGLGAVSLVDADECRIPFHEFVQECAAGLQEGVGDHHHTAVGNRRRFAAGDEHHGLAGVAPAQGG